MSRKTAHDLNGYLTTLRYWVHKRRMD